MATTNKNIPALRFPEFKGEWERVNLGEISHAVMYGMNAAAKEFDGINKYIRITDIDDNSRSFDTSSLTSPDGELLEKYILKEGDILFARTGASVGKSYYYKNEDGRVFFAGFLIKFHIKKEEANPYFVFSTTFKTEYKKWVLKMSMRSGQPGINAEEYKTFEFNTPSLPEQKKIAAFLSSVDERLQQLQQQQTLLEQYKKGLLQQVFTQKIRFKDVKGKDYPIWEEKKLGEIAIRKTEKNKDLKQRFVLTNSATQGIVSQTEYFDKEIANQDNLTGYYIVEVDDFVYNPRISVNAPVGPIKRNKYCTGVMSPLYSVFSFHQGVLEYIEYFFESTFWHTHMENIANYGARHDRMNITTKDFYDMDIPFPSIEEQTKIANFLSAIDEQINTVKQQIAQTQQFKKGLLQQMFV